IKDNGFKKGLNGLDNGMIKFNNLFLKRECLLNKFGFIDVNGKYVGSYNDEGKRFAELISTLSAGRAIIASGSNIVACKALMIACRYGLVRKQFVDGSGKERRLMDYVSHQYLLM